MPPFALLVPLAVLFGFHATPKSGEELIRQMHERYAGKWYHNLTFTQTTSFPDRPAETWYEAGEIPGKLRIDIAPLDSMNAFMYLGRLRHRVQRRKAGGGERGSKPPHDPGLRCLRAAAPDHGRPDQGPGACGPEQMREDNWRGTKVWVVGAEKGDTVTNQFWIEQDRLLFVRLIEQHKNPKKPEEKPATGPRHHLRGLSAAGQGVGRPDLRDQGGRERAAAGEVPEHPGRREAAIGPVRPGDVPPAKVGQREVNARRWRWAIGPPPTSINRGCSVEHLLQRREPFRPVFLHSRCRRPVRQPYVLQRSLALLCSLAREADLERCPIRPGDPHGLVSGCRPTIH